MNLQVPVIAHRFCWRHRSSMQSCWSWGARKSVYLFGICSLDRGKLLTEKNIVWFLACQVMWKEVEHTVCHKKGKYQFPCTNYIWCNFTIPIPPYSSLAHKHLGAVTLSTKRHQNPLNQFLSQLVLTHHWALSLPLLPVPCPILKVQKQVYYSHIPSHNTQHRGAI